MPQKVIDLLRLLKPLPKEQEAFLDTLARYVEEKDLTKIKVLLKQDKLQLRARNYDPYTGGIPPLHYVAIEARSQEEEVTSYVTKLQRKIQSSLEELSFKQFSQQALPLLEKLIAPQILGLDNIKKAVALQLFAKEPFHLLLIGDPGTGKTDILRSILNLHPITSFGLGSGTTNAGLGIVVKGETIDKGLLPLADKGICCIDELNLLKEHDRASLYNAMEKGFVTYDKGGEHMMLPAHIRLLATANPKGLRFVGKTAKSLKAQIPLDAALMSRFHVLFALFKPDAEKLAHIARHVMKSPKPPSVDYSFIKDYVEYAEGLEVEFPDALQKKVVAFITSLKEHEAHYLNEVTPRTVVGVMRIAKASARMELRTEVKEKDIELAEMIIEQGLIEDIAKDTIT